MTQATIAIAGEPIWTAEFNERLGEAYRIVILPQHAGYLNRLVELQPVMIFVDGGNEAWTEFITTAKTSSATRRIPIVLITEDVTQRSESANVGADFAFALSDLLSQLAQLLKQYARVMSADEIEQLDCDCQEALPPLAVEGVAMFNAGEYYRQHDLFEEQWVQTNGPVRDLYRAVLQVGVAYYQIERGNYRGAMKMLQRSVQWLVRLPDVCQGIDVRRLREDSYKVRAELEQLGESGLTAFDHSLIRGVEMVG